MENWKVKMERWLTDGQTPDVKVKSSFTYELPRDWSGMLDAIDEVDVEYHSSIVAGIHKHLHNEFGRSGFMPVELIPPTEYEV